MSQADHLDEQITTEVRPPTAGGAPSFPTVMRGYDRAQVDRRLHELQGALEEERDRSRDSEQEVSALRQEIDRLHAQEQPAAPAPPNYAELGRSAGQTLEEVGRIAERLHRQADEEAQAVVSEARAEAADIVVAAKQRAEELETQGLRSLQQAEAQLELARANARGLVEELHEKARQEAERVKLEAEETAARVAEELGERRAGLEEAVRRLEEERLVAARALRALVDRLGEALEQEALVGPRAAAQNGGSAGAGVENLGATSTT